MEIIKELPPNWEQIKNVYNPNPKTTVVTIGNKLYNPGGNPIDYYLLAHEMTHERQQQELGVNAWWELYLTQPEFMLKEEIEAYNNQYKTFCKENKTKGIRKEFLNLLAEQLSGNQYGKNITKQEAINSIAK